MYRLQIYHERRWKWGIRDYSLEEAQKRIGELKAHGIKARVKPIAELLG